MKILNVLVQVSLSLSLFASIVTSPLSAIAKPLAPHKIPGTAVQLALPEGFQPSQNFPGFEQPDTGASVLVTELPIPKDKALQVLEQFSSASALKTRGMRLIESQPISISGIPGKLLLLSQSNRGIAFLKWVVVATAGDRTLIVTTSFPESESARLKEPLRRNIMSLTWTPSQPVSQLEGLPFTFKLAGDLQVSERVSNMVMLSQNGMKPPIPDSQPVMVLGAALDTVRIPNLEKFSRMRLKAIPQVQRLAETSGSAKTISGHPAFELVALGYDLKTNTPLTVYQVIITANQTYYIVQGFMPTTKAQTYLPIFRSVADSFAPKPKSLTFFSREQIQAISP
jgi:hypothetical protein